MIVGVDLMNVAVREARITGYESFNWTHSYHEMDTFEFAISGDLAVAAQLAVYKGVLLIEKIGNETYQYPGIIDFIEDDITSFKRLIVKGVSYGKFNKRISANGLSAGDGYDKQVDTPVNLMRHYVDVNCITTAAKRKVENLLIGTADAINVTDYTFEFRGEYIKECLQKISYATGVGWRVMYRNGNFHFDVYEGPTISNIIFTRSGGTLEELKIISDVSNYANACYVFAEGEGSTRTIEEIDDGSVGILRDEMLLSVSKDDSAIDEGNAALKEVSEVVTIEATPLENNFVYGVNYTLGDIIKVSEAGSVYEARLVEVKDEFNGGFWTKKFTLGKKKQSFSNQYKYERRNFWHLARM